MARRNRQDTARLAVASGLAVAGYFVHRSLLAGIMLFLVGFILMSADYRATDDIAGLVVGVACGIGAFWIFSSVLVAYVAFIIGVSAMFLFL